MCYNIQYMERRQEKMAQRYKAVVPKPISEQLQIPIFMASAFSHPLWPVITTEKPDEFQLFRWGLIPYWTKDMQGAKKIRIMTPNCIGEEAWEKPSFRAAIPKKRCLIPVTGFFEWHTIGKNKYPHYIYMKDKEPFAMAGIYDTWVNKEDGEIFNTYSILTTSANPLLEKIHNTKKRMPVILKQQDEGKWIDSSLSKEEINGLIKPYPESEMAAHAISKLITSRTENPNQEKVIEPFTYPELTAL